jgi:hypothetical protein
MVLSENRRLSPQMAIFFLDTDDDLLEKKGSPISQISADLGYFKIVQFVYVENYDYLSTFESCFLFGVLVVFKFMITISGGDFPLQAPQMGINALTQAACLCDINCFPICFIMKSQHHCLGG